MLKPLPSPPSLDLASLSIHDLWCLSELFEHLGHEALSFLNQPRVNGPLAEYTSAFWDRFCNGAKAQIIEEIQQRVPANRTEADWKAEAIIRHLSQGDSFNDILEAVSTVIESKRNFAA